jgi:hypothetical protein
MTLSYWLAASMAAVVVVVGGAWVARRHGANKRSAADDAEPNEFLLTPPTSFPVFISEPDQLLLDEVRAQVDAEIQAEAVPAGDPEAAADEQEARSEPAPIPMLVPYHHPILDPSYSDTAESTVLVPSSADDLMIDLTGPEPIVTWPAVNGSTRPETGVIELVGSVKALELAQRLSLPMAWPPQETSADPGTDPVVQALIDRVRVKQWAAHRPAAPAGGRPAAGTPVEDLVDARVQAKVGSGAGEGLH